jgi:hypothetical protein
MAKTGAHWSKSPASFGEAVKASVYELTRDRAIAIFDYVVANSPVDTGAYRASWTISEGAPRYMYAGKPLIRGAVLSPPSTPKLSTKFYRKFYIANGSPYALAIEHGWSGQAPHGVLRQAIKATAK